MKASRGWKESPGQHTTPEPPSQRPLFAKASLLGRLGGLSLMAVGLWLLSAERVTIARTGHAGRKSAAVPVIICCGLAYLIDPDTRRIGILITLLILGFVGGVAWFIFLQ